jgi:hypothetical protein
MDEDPKSTQVVKTNRGYTLTMTCHYADKTPDGFWEDVYRILEHFCAFDSIMEDCYEKQNL